MKYELILDELLLHLTTDNGLLFFVLLNFTVWIYNVGMLFMTITIPCLICYIVCIEFLCNLSSYYWTYMLFASVP
jgi:hypothetical protein